MMHSLTTNKRNSYTRSSRKNAFEHSSYIKILYKLFWSSLKREFLTCIHSRSMLMMWEYSYYSFYSLKEIHMFCLYCNVFNSWFASTKMSYFSFSFCVWRYMYVQCTYMVVNVGIFVTLATLGIMCINPGWHSTTKLIVLTRPMGHQHKQTQQGKKNRTCVYAELN